MVKKKSVYQLEEINPRPISDRGNQLSEMQRFFGSQSLRDWRDPLLSTVCGCSINRRSSFVPPPLSPCSLCVRHV